MGRQRFSVSNARQPRRRRGLMVRILRTPHVEADMTEIWTRIARDNPFAADKLIRRLDEEFHAIAANPDIGLRQDEIRPGLRCKPIRKMVFDLLRSR